MANAFSLYSTFPALQCHQRGNFQHLYILVSTRTIYWVVTFFLLPISIPMSAKGLLLWLPAIVSQNDYRESSRKDDTILALLFQAVPRLGANF